MRGLHLRCETTELPPSDHSHMQSRVAFGRISTGVHPEDTGGVVLGPCLNGGLSHKVRPVV